MTLDSDNKAKSAHKASSRLKIN